MISVQGTRFHMLKLRVQVLQLRPGAAKYLEKKKISLFSLIIIWLCWVLVVACKFLVAACGI